MTSELLNNNEMDFEKEEHVLNVMLDTVAHEDILKIQDICGDKHEVLYDSWVLLHGEELANKWVDDHGGEIVGYDDIAELSNILIKSFIKWLKMCNR